MGALRVLEEPSEYTSQVNEDNLWKKVIADLFEDFVLFFLPKFHGEVDFSKPVEFLQQELFKEITDKRKGLKRTDQIAKVYLKNGAEQWVLVHTELQMNDSEEFSKRMFEYFYRIYDQHGQKIVAIALVTKQNKKSTNTFEYLYFGTELTYTFNKYMISDFDEEKLKESPKLFSKALLAAYYMNKSTNDANRRMEFKEYLLKEVALLKGVGQIEISALFYFIDYLMLLPDDLSQQLRKKILLFVRKEELEMVQFREEDLSPTLAAIIEMGREDGIERGLEQGREQGLEQGKLLEKEETAKQLLKLSMPIDQIVIVTALSIDEIEALK